MVLSFNMPQLKGKVMVCGLEYQVESESHVTSGRYTK